jgi:hypothetical protein
MGLYESLKEALNLKKKSTGVLLIASPEYRENVYPIITFDQLNNIQIGDGDIGSAIDLIAGQVVRGGFETSMDETYAETTADGLTAKEVVDDKAQEMGLDQIIKENVVDVVGYGESIVWKGTGAGVEFLARLLPPTIQSFNFDKETGIFLKSVHTTLKDYPASEIVRYSYNHIGKQQIGFGVLQALGTTLTLGGKTRPSYAEIKTKVMEAMRKQIENFASPRQMWVLPDAPDAKLEEYNAKIKKMSEGETVVYNKPGATVINAVAERMRGMDLYVEKIWNSFFLTLQTPIPQLFAGGQLTQASANAALSVAEVAKIDDLRRVVKRITEEQIFAPWLKEVGLDPLKAKVRLNWRQLQRPDSNVLLPILERSREFGDLTRVEMRRIYADMGLPIDPKETLSEEQMPTKPVTSSINIGRAADQPVQSALNKYKMRPNYGNR